jgi:hypothetical protein
MKNTKNYYQSQSTVSKSNSLPSSSNTLFNKQIQKFILLLTNNDNTNYTTKKINDSFLKEVANLNNLKKQLPNYSFVTELLLMTQLINVINNYINITNDLNTQIINLEDAITFASNRNDTSNYIVNKQVLVQDTMLNLEYVQYLIMFDVQQSNGLFLENNLKLAREVLKNNGNRLQYNF